MSGYREDFHIHTNYSDGQAAPTAIVRRAAELGYERIAITDHDGIDGIDEALRAGREACIEVVPGIEIATRTGEGIGLHILGHYIDHRDRQLCSVLHELEKNREQRNKRLISVLKDMGYDISADDLLAQQPNGYIGKPVIARALVDKGYIGTIREAFREGQLLGSPQAKAVKKEKLDSAQAVRLITAAGGRAVLAHPIQTRGVGEKGSSEFYENIECIVVRLKEEGLAGIECFHPDQNREQSERFRQMAEKHGLCVTRGSDFHGRDFACAESTAETAAEAAGSTCEQLTVCGTDRRG